MSPWLPALCLLLAIHTGAEKTKRQIYREQVVPFAGGKIPEDAFRSDRLALNHLNKDGVSVPDGVVFNTRGHHKHPIRQNSDLQQSVIKILVTPENRYTAPVGMYHNQRPQTVDSTYIIRPPAGAQKHLAPTVVRVMPGPPLQIPNPHASVQPRPQIHRQLEKLHVPEKLYLGFPDDVSSVNSYLLPSNNHVVFPDSIDGYATTSKEFSDFDSLLAHLNERAAREAAAALAASAPAFKPWPSKLPGVEGLDFPAFTSIPETSFQCGLGRSLAHRMFADPDTKCQVFHICQKDGRRDSFLCPKGTLFNEDLSHCDWWYNVTCRP